MPIPKMRQTDILSYTQNAEKDTLFYTKHSEKDTVLGHLTTKREIGENKYEHFYPQGPNGKVK